MTRIETRACRYHAIVRSREARTSAGEKLTLVERAGSWAPVDVASATTASVVPSDQTSPAMAQPPADPPEPSRIDLISGSGLDVDVHRQSLR